LPWLPQLQVVQERGTTEAQLPELSAIIRASNRQHPDRD
jgi:hypothetical protein